MPPHPLNTNLQKDKENKTAEVPFFPLRAVLSLKPTGTHQKKSQMFSKFCTESLRES